MSPETEPSGSEIVVEFLKLIWMPAGEALRVQKDLDVHSLNETPAAAERAGFEVSHVDLPPKVSGFATVIEGKPHIVVNRAKSQRHQQYTLSHELGHQVLHLNPPSTPVRSRFSSQKNMVEFEAHMFAATWIISVANETERDDLLKQNPEAGIVPFLAVCTTAVILVVALIVYVWSRLRTQPPKSIEER